MTEFKEKDVGEKQCTQEEGWYEGDNMFAVTWYR